jgi:hypothetical protein
MRQAKPFPLYLVLAGTIFGTRTKAGVQPNRLNDPTV